MIMNYYHIKVAVITKILTQLLQYNSLAFEI